MGPLIKCIQELKRKSTGVEVDRPNKSHKNSKGLVQRQQDDLETIPSKKILHKTTLKPLPRVDNIELRLSSQKSNTLRKLVNANTVNDSSLSENVNRYSSNDPFIEAETKEIQRLEKLLRIKSGE